MPSPSIRQFARKREGESISATEWNLLIELLGRTVLGVGVVDSPVGIAMIPPKATGGATIQVLPFVVKTIGSNILTCRSYDYASATEGTADIYILKPVPLRLETWNGKTINGVAYSGSASARTATGTVTEQQVVTPPYVTGTWALGAGILAVPLSTPIIRDTKSCTYQEVCSSRDWAWNGL